MFDFLKYRYACLVFFLVILSATVGGYWYNIQKRGYGFHYSVDFTGGTSALFKLKNYSQAMIEYNEYLRILERGYRIRAVHVESDAVSVDTQEDLEFVREKRKQLRCNYRNKCHPDSSTSRLVLP